MSYQDPALIDLNSVTPDVNTEHLEEIDPSGSKEVFRSTQSLGLITQRFMSLRQKNEVMNLNDVAKELNISKRRVYDVINVLEGLGYVQKVEKNNIQWIGESMKKTEQDKLEATVEVLRQEEKILEMMLRDIQSTIRIHLEDPVERTYNYVHKEEIRTTCAPDTKSIIVKSDIDASSTFEIQVTDPNTSGTYEMIVRNRNGVKSHALLFSNELPMKTEQESPEKSNNNLCDEDSKLDWTLTEMTENSDQRAIKEEPEELDTEDLETFVLPTTSNNPSDLQYIPETPGRGLFFSPFKNLIDPCILPAYSDDLNSGYIHIKTPARAAIEREEHRLTDKEPESVLDFFSD